jgi:hypothetical protein
MLVSLAAVVAFVVALVSFRQVPVKECQMAATNDPSYSAKLVEPPEVNSTTYHLAVTHDGAPVEGATVCIRADMGGPGGMSGMGASNVAREVAPGSYEVDIAFPMGGRWEGRIVVQEPGAKPVDTPLNITVT